MHETVPDEVRHAMELKVAALEERARRRQLIRETLT
jgi:hypothetical protein